MADRSSWMSEIDSPSRMAARVPQHFGGSDGAVSGLAVEGAVLPQGVALPPGFELNYPPYPALSLLRKAPVGSGVRSGEYPSSNEGSGPVPEWVLDQAPRSLSKINVQQAKTQPPLSRYGFGGEGPDQYQYGSGDGSVSDMSVSGASEKHGETVFRGCSSANSSLGEHPGPRLKLMCSFGGKILPRPGDGKLRYAGGETRIVSVRRHISYADLMRKMTQLYGHTVLMKYQLPDEDLDALVSVSSDEDLQNMMEEYDRLETGEGNPRVRIFISSPAEYDVAQRSDSADRKNIDLLYVDAINGLSESLSGKQLDIPSPSASNNLIGFEGSDNWNAPRIPESVPVSVLASPVFEGTAAPSLMQSMPVGITSNNKPVLSRILSAPPSASASPPVFSQAFQVRQFPIPDIPLNVSPDQPIKAPVGHSFEMHRGDGTYHEVEGVGSATSSVNSQHDGSYEPRRLVDSPTKAQQETMLAYRYNLDQLYRPEQLRMADIGGSRVDSQSTLPHSDSYGHGKLMPQAPFLAGENHIPNIMRPPLDRQTFGAQPQLQAAQTAVQPSLEFRHEGYQWMDPMQQSAAESMQAQQQALLHSQLYHPAGMDLTQHSAPERMQRQVQSPHYRQEFVPQFYPPTGIGLPQQSALESIPQQQAAHHRQQIFSQLHAPVGTSGQEVAAFKQADQSLQQEDALTGQVPFKSIALQTTLIPPGIGEVPVTLSHLASAPLPPGVAFGGLQYLPAPGGLVDLPYGKATVQPNNEQLYMENQIAREQAHAPFVNLEKVSQENKGDSLQRKQDVQQSQSYYSDELPRPVIPMLRRENIEHLQQHEDEEFAVRPPYQDGVDWSMQKTYNDSEEMMGGWTQMGQVDRKKELASDFTSSEFFGKLPANAPGLHILEPPFVAAVASDTHSAAENTGKQFDPLGSTPAHLRAGLVPSVVSGHPPTLASTSFSESSQQPYLPARFEGDDLPMLAITQAGTSTLDASSFPSSHEALHGNPVSLATQRIDDMAAGIVPQVHTGSLLVPPPNTVPSANKDERLAKMEEGQWTGDFESDPLAGNESGVRSNEDALDGGLNRPASGNMTSNPEDLLGVSAVIKTGSNQSSTDEGAFVPPFSHVQTMVPNGTSYPIGLSPWGMGLDAFQTNIILSPPTCASAAGGLSTTNPSFPVIIDAATASNILAPAGKDSSYGKTTVSRPREELVESAQTRADLAFLDNARPITAPFVIPFDSGQVSEGLQEKGLFPPFNSDTMRAPETTEREDEDIKRDLEHVANDVAAAVLQPAITLSMQNWDDTLANVEDEEEITKEGLSIYKSLDEVRSHAGEKTVTFQEMEVCSREADTDGLVTDKPANVAVIAEEDAISHGLQTIKNSDLEELRELGSGTFGTVYHGKWRGTDVAIKRIKSSCFIGRPSERERLIADFWREAYILGQLHHPNVVAFYGVVRDGPGGTLATVTEYMVNGSLKQVLQRKDRTIDRRKRLLIIMDAAFGMEYLHGKNIVHFDLKCENLLVNMRDPQRPICKVGDLGLSKVKQQTMVSGGVRGTLPWMAPELLNGSSSLVSEKVDVFSFGIVMWELVTGEEPYANMHYGAIIGGIVSNTLRPSVPNFCDPAWKSLMERCWSAEPGERPSFTEIASELRAMATSASSKVQVQAQTAGSG